MTVADRPATYHEVFAEPSFRALFLARGFGGQTLRLATSEDSTAEAWSLVVERLQSKPDYAHTLFAR